MAGISALGYFGIGASDLDAWAHYASEIVGMQVTRADEDGKPVLYLRMDERHHRIAVRPGKDQVDYVGWEVASAADLDGIVRDLEAAGVPCKEDAELARLRGAHRLVTCTDPAGINVEFFAGGLVPKDPFVSPAGVRFVTKEPSGKDTGLGHVVFGCQNPEETMAFYIDVLGFRVSDYIIPAPGFHVTFLHVNARHHSFAAAGAPLDTGTALNHFMLEVADIDSVGRALDRARAADTTMQATLGRHTNDEMLSFYMQTPSGFGLEYGTGGRLIDDATWTVVTYTSSEWWGHERDHHGA
ncbi:VOC family protein [Amycolatopsis sp. GM8]|uniref:VOC family protein n=1 Tax=Amycolatopsis sp. GM8 TaxID=2896530 RepID=UPI001F240761|nr:VOC family protein [Amycolatopsis sp. GM8]